MRILLGVTGGIAAYKACELVSLSIKAGHEVRVVLSANGARFVGAATFEALTGHSVLSDTFEGADSGGIDHIEWAKWCDVACIAPLTANTLGKLACGLADDALSTVFMALPRGKICVLAPAMNTEMWFHPVVQRNLKWLSDMDRYRIVDPIEKRLACGDEGLGGLAEPESILAAVEAAG
jgi:phosphopantothenoylcysteine decarboxylase/phosphopantothenate--cysteine ligase